MDALIEEQHAALKRIFVVPLYEIGVMESSPQGQVPLHAPSSETQKYVEQFPRICTALKCSPNEQRGAGEMPDIRRIVIDISEERSPE